VTQDYVDISIRSAKQVGPAIFFSVMIMVVSFLPVFLLEGQEGKNVSPARVHQDVRSPRIGDHRSDAGSRVDDHADARTFQRDDEKPGDSNTHGLYAPVIRWVLDHRAVTIGLNVVALLVAIPMVVSMGSEFMPPLDEGSLLFMPVTLPSASITEVNRIMQVQDAIIKSVPEVESVLGKAGRAETATDPAPLSMIESIILLKPKEQWRHGITKDDIVAGWMQNCRCRCAQRVDASQSSTGSICFRPA